MHAMHAPALRGASLASSLKASAPRARVSRPVRSTIRADAQVIDGKAIAADVREEVRLAVAAMKEKTGGKVPGLADVLVGDRKDSETCRRTTRTPTCTAS
jgi:hypothetical protein